MIQIFLKMKEQYIKTEMEYPLNFWLMLLSGVVTRFFGMLVPFIICSNIKTIAGWKQEEIYLIMSFLYLSEGLCSVLFEGIWQLPSMVFNGNFDTILSRIRQSEFPYASSLSSRSACALFAMVSGRSAESTS